MPSCSQPLPSEGKPLDPQLGNEPETSAKEQTKIPPKKTRAESWLFLFLLLALSANLLYPGEIFFQSKYLLVSGCLLAGLFASLLLLYSSTPRDALKPLIHCFAPFLVLLPSLFTSINQQRSLEVFTLFFSFACLVFSLRVSPPTRIEVWQAILLLCLAAFAINLYSLYQYFFGLSQLKNLLAQDVSMEPGLRSALWTRAASGRVFGNFTLPNSLAGFACMMLPLQACWVYFAFSRQKAPPPCSWKDFEGALKRLATKPLIRTVIVLQLALGLVILALTQSFGGWVCLLVSLLFLGVVYVKKHSIRPRLVLLFGLLLLLGVSAGIYWVSRHRGFGLLNFSVYENPIALRWLNFKVALSIFRDFPWFGVGLGNYGTINPAYQQAVVTVTQFTHNTPLQLLSECGLPFLILAGIWGGSLARRCFPQNATPGSEKKGYDFVQIGLLVSLSAWATHNLIDINLYFPSLGGLGIFLLALYMGQFCDKSSGVNPQCQKARSRGAKVWLYILILAIALAGVNTFSAYYAQTLAAQAVELVSTKNFQKAETCLERAVRWQPLDPSLAFLYSNLQLKTAFENGTLDQSRLLGLKLSYQKAVALDPYNAEYHYQLSKILAASGETNAAEVEKRRAQALFPAELKYRK
ncbi:MAG: O-antigen ligase family protein [Terriglobia bacterium]